MQGCECVGLILFFFIYSTDLIRPLYGGVTLSEQIIHVEPGEAFNLTCITSGSLAIEWLSNEYVGTGNSGVGFPLTEMPGDERLVRNTTITLIRKDGEGNATILESSFSTVATVSSTIICRATTIGENSTATIVVGK